MLCPSQTHLLAPINTSSTLQAANQPWPSPSSLFCSKQVLSLPSLPHPKSYRPAGSRSKERTRDGYGDGPRRDMEKSPKLPMSPSTLGGEMHPGGVGSVQGKSCNSPPPPSPCTISSPREGGSQTFSTSLPAHDTPQPPHRHAAACSALYVPAKQPGTAAGGGGTRPRPQECRIVAVGWGTWRSAWLGTS